MAVLTPSWIMCLKGNENQLLDAHLWSFFPCSCCTHYKSVSRISDMIASVMIFAEPHADGALAFGIKDQLTTLTRYHI